MINFTVKELMALQKLKTCAEKYMNLESQVPYHWSLDDLTALTKLCDGFSESKVKIRYRKPRDKKPVVHVCGDR